MKYTALFAIAAVNAEDLFLQLNDCNRSGVSGVTCEPAHKQLFATGMNGDEDLGEDITMKGNKFHFVQNPSLAQWDAKGLPAIPYPAQDAKQAPQKKDYAKGYDAPEQVHVLDPKIGKKATTFYLGQQEYDTKGLPAIPYPAQDAKEGKPDKKWNEGYDAPEQVHVLDPKTAKKATTFYLGQQE